MYFPVADFTWASAKATAQASTRSQSQLDACTSARSRASAQASVLALARARSQSRASVSAEVWSWAMARVWAVFHTQPPGLAQPVQPPLALQFAHILYNQALSGDWVAAQALGDLYLESLGQ